MIGVHPAHHSVDLPVQRFFGLGGALRVAWYGDCLPSRDFPILIDLYLAGRLVIYLLDRLH